MSYFCFVRNTEPQSLNYYQADRIGSFVYAPNNNHLMKSDKNFGNNRVALTHIVQVQDVMFAQGHYLHIVKGCVNRA